MKKSIVAALVGGLIIFLWQFLSWGVINLHEPAQQYTPKQEAILSFFAGQELEEGGYYMPGTPKNVGIAEYDKIMQDAAGKPWATIQYHKQLDTGMGMNMARGMAANVLTVALLCWIIGRFRTPRFAPIFTASLLTGLIVFLNESYTNHIWFKTFDVWASLTDAVVSWTLCGLWLAWYLGRSSKRMFVRAKGYHATTLNLE